MEAAEKVVESYFRYVRGYFTIPNVSCKGGKELDLIGIRQSENTIDKVHVEVSVTTTGVFSKLNADQFVPENLKIRGKGPAERVKIGYFIEHKFNNSYVKDKLIEYGFSDGAYQKVIVAWDWKPEIEPVIEARILISE